MPARLPDAEGSEGSEADQDEVFGEVTYIGDSRRSGTPERLGLVRHQKDPN
jgi:hypothetical protein